jgi:hypothetical protein
MSCQEVSLGRGRGVDARAPDLADTLGACVGFGSQQVAYLIQFGDQLGQLPTPDFLEQMPVDPFVVVHQVVASAREVRLGHLREARTRLGAKPLGRLAEHAEIP